MNVQFRPPPADDHLDLTLTRVVNVPRHKLFEGWTKPELMKQWFAPKPWSIAECEVDLRRGGMSRIVMRSPEGELFPNTGCFLEVVENELLVFTDALSAGFRPSAQPFFTALVMFEDEPSGGTLYTARAMHATEEARKQHEAMGFHTGWGQCLDQLVELVG